MEETTSAARSRLRRMGLPALVTGAALAVYGNTLENGFVWDDNDIIVDNPAVRDLGSIPSLFSSVDATRTAHHAAYYRPLARLTYLLDYQLFGLSPAGYHLGNVLLHALAVLALFLLVRALFGDATRALAAALLFAVHPLNAEAANFVSTRNTILATLFTLVALSAYHRARAGGPAALFPASWLSFLAGLLSKETAAGLLLLLPVYDLPRPAELRATLRGRALRLLPFVAVFAGYLALRTHALSSAIGADLDLSGLPARLGRIAYLVPRYLGIVLFPLELNAYYQLPQDWPSRWPWLALAWAAIAAALWLCLRLRSRAAAFGLLWFGVNLLPIVGVVPIPSAVMAERYLYLPAVGLWIVAGDLFARAWARARARPALAAAGVAVALALSLATVRRNRVWRDPLTFYSAMAEAQPDAVLARYSLGLAHLVNGHLAAAAAEWEAAAHLDPSYFDVAGQLGGLLAREGQLHRAEHWLGRAVQSGSASPAALYNLARVKDMLGKGPEAVGYYRLFLERSPAELGGAAARARARLAELGGEPPP